MCTVTFRRDVLGLGTTFGSIAINDETYTYNGMSLVLKGTPRKETSEWVVLDVAGPDPGPYYVSKQTILHVRFKP